MSEPAKLVEFVFFRNFATLTGGVSEWLKEPASKTGVRETVSGVRIPSPPRYAMHIKVPHASAAFLFSGAPVESLLS